MDIVRATYFSISTEDRAGALARFAKLMLEHNINLAGVWGFGLGRGSAQIVAIPHDPIQFRKALKGTSWSLKEGSCFHLTGEDRAGALSEVLDQIAGEGINLHAVDAMGFEKRYSAYVWCDEQDIEKLRKILKGW